jgi:hypothetical protein
MQSFGLLNQFLPSISILDKGSPFWHFSLQYIFFNIILPPQRVFGLPVGLFEMGLQESIGLTILVSGILSIWPNHPTLSALAKFIMFYYFI